MLKQKPNRIYSKMSATIQEILSSEVSDAVIWYIVNQETTITEQGTTIAGLSSTIAGLSSTIIRLENKVDRLLNQATTITELRVDVDQHDNILDQFTGPDEAW